MIKVVTSEMVFGALRQLGVAGHGILLADENYVLPAADWIHGEFADWFTAEMRNKPYKVEVFDCDNFARAAAYQANECHRLAVLAGGGSMAGVAFGELWVATRQHAVNWAGHWSDDGGLRIAVYEPQITQADGKITGASFAELQFNAADWESVTLAKA